MRKYISPVDIANDVRITRTHYKGAFLLVEGKMSDLCVFRRFTDGSHCQLIPTHGKENALEVMNILKKDNINGVLAIVDADFWHVNNVKSPSKNILMTDTHDLETMMISSPSFDKVLVEFGSETKIKTFTKKNHKKPLTKILKSGAPIGALRWISEDEKLNLTFKDIKFNKFIDRKSLDINIILFIETVKNKSSHFHLDENIISSSIKKIIIKQYNLFNLCCGHDLVKILSVGLYLAIGSNRINDIKSEIIEKFLRVGYELEYFKKTQLCKDVLEWEKKNNYKILN